MAEPENPNPPKEGEGSTGPQQEIRKVQLVLETTVGDSQEAEDVKQKFDAFVKSFNASQLKGPAHASIQEIVSRPKDNGPQKPV